MTDGPAPLSRRERAALQGVLDTLLPVACNGAIDAIERAILGPALHDRERRDARTLLLAFSSAAGTSVLCLSPSTRAFAERTRAERQRLFLRLGTSPLHLHRRAFLALKRLALSVACSHVPDDQPNPLWAHAGYPGPGPALEGPAASLPAYAGPPAAPTLVCDVVVVGSGAGGGVAAAVFARAGLDVVVLEKGSYVPPAQLTGLETEAFATLYEKGGLLTTSDGAIGVLAGSTLGGGTPLSSTPQPPRMHNHHDHNNNRYHRQLGVLPPAPRLHPPRVGGGWARPIWRRFENLRRRDSVGERAWRVEATPACHVDTLQATSACHVDTLSRGLFAPGARPYRRHSR